MELNSTVMWSLISIIISLIGSICFGYLFYKLALKKKSLICDIDTICLISEDISHINGLNINYNSSTLESLHRSTIKIKNSGNTIIDKNDIAPKAPLSLSTKGKFLFDKPIIQITNDEDNIQLKYEITKTELCSHAIIDFDFISKKRTIEFSVLHTKNIKFNGRIKDGDIIKENNNVFINNSKKVINVSKQFTPIIISSFAICIFLSIFSLLSYQKRTEEFINDIQSNINTIEYEAYDSKYSIAAMQDYIKQLETEIEKLQLQLETESYNTQSNITIQ